MAGIFVEWTRRPLHDQLAFPPLGERRRIVDLKLIEIEERVDVEQAEALDEVEIPIRSCRRRRRRSRRCRAPARRVDLFQTIGEAQTAERPKPMETFALSASKR